MSERISYEQMDRATWRALARAFRHAEKALDRLYRGDDDGMPTAVAKQALEDMRAEVETCQDD